MRIATKLNVGIFAVFTASVMLNYVVLEQAIKPQFEQIEVSSSLVNHKLVTDAIETLCEKLRSAAQTWGFWTEGYRFASGEGDAQQFISEGLAPAPDVVTALGVNVLIFRSLDGAMIWGAAYDLATRAPIPGLAQEISSLAYRHPFLDGARDPTAAYGLIRTSAGLVKLSIAPILRTDRSGPAAGTLIVACILDADQIQTLSGVDFVFDAIPAAGTDLTTTAVWKTLVDTVETSSLISDINEKPLAILRAATPRDVSKAGEKAIKSAVLHMMIAAFAVILALWLFVRSIVVSRIAALKDHFANAGENGQIRHTDFGAASDEIGELAKSFNQMAEQVNHLRDAIVDSAYLSGMSEWAAGTLHNVRNALSPINLGAWKVKNLFEEPWLRNLKSAHEQLSRPETPADRKQKLESYILTSTPHVLDCAEQAKRFADEIRSASRAVDDIVSSHEPLGQLEAEREPIDILPLIKDVAKSTIESKAAHVQLSLPSDSAVVVSNRTVLRQILSNLLLNALEALNVHNRHPQIRVELRTVNGGSTLQLLVSDNGEGIAAQRVKSIFERGHSTRQCKRRGLGLHWCANAANALGGSLQARSNGPGTGATLVLCLPASSSTESVKEVA